MAPKVRWVLAAGRAVARAVVPTACPGCGLPDVRWCEACAAPWWEEPFRSEAAAGRLSIEGRPALPVWSVCRLEGPAHLMVAAWKDGGRRDLDRFFAATAERAALALAPAFRLAVAVVPVPPHRRSVRARGVDLTLALARAVAAGLSDTGLSPAGGGPGVARLLVNRGGESRRRGDRARWANAIRGLHAVEGGVWPTTVILVDDVITTGRASPGRVTSSRAAESLWWGLSPWPRRRRAADRDLRPVGKAHLTNTVGR